MALIVQGPEYRVSIGKIELGDGRQIQADALEVAEVHTQGLEKNALDCEVVADGGYRSLRVPVADVEDGVPGAFLEPDDRLATGHGEGANVDAPLFQDVGISLTQVGAVEAIELTDVQLSEVVHGIDGEGAGLGNWGCCLDGPGLRAGIDRVQLLGGESAAKGLGLAKARFVERGVAGALESTFLIGVGLAVSYEDDAHAQTRGEGGGLLAFIH